MLYAWRYGAAPSFKSQIILRCKASNTAGNATDYYIAKIDYKSVDKNQNLENNAALSIKFSIR